MMKVPRFVLVTSVGSPSVAAISFPSWSRKLKGVIVLALWSCPVSGVSDILASLPLESGGFAPTQW